MSGTSPSDSTSGPPPGAVLAAARVAQGFTVENVAGRLKLAPFQIAAIEAGNFSALPGVVFARGFVKNYARLLNLDSEPLLQAMTRDGPKQDERLLREVKGMALEPGRYRRLPAAVAVVVAAAVSMLAYYEFVLNESRPAEPLPQTRLVPIHPVLASGNENIAPVPAEAELQVLQGIDRNKPVSAAENADRGLHFRFTQASWVEVRDGVGNVLFSKISLPGAEHRVTGVPPFSVIVGSVKGVQLAYNGKPIDLAAHATRDVARLRIEQ